MNHLLSRRIDVAAHHQKADLVLKNARIINVFTEEILAGDVAIIDGHIAAIGQDYHGHEMVDCSNRFVCPGFIDAHVHIESSMVTPREFAKAVMPSGTTAVIADPHELVNVCGSAAMTYLLEEAQQLPMDLYVMLPSCVPATPFETNGGEFSAADMVPFIGNKRVLGLGEVMSYPDVLAKSPAIMDKLSLTQGMPKDGHAPLLTGSQLAAYRAAGIDNDHECTTFDEALEKYRCGMAILVRQGSAAHNLTAILKGWLAHKLPFDGLLMCTDDKHLADIAHEGHIRHNIRLAIAVGVPPITAIKMATINTARFYHLKDVGAVSAGYQADLVILDDLDRMSIHRVYKSGRPIDTLSPSAPAAIPQALLHTMHGAPITLQDLALPVQGETHCIEMLPHQLTTEHRHALVDQKDGLFLPNAHFNKLCVAERHGKGGAVAVCPLIGYNLKGGAIATSVAHDSHNIIAAGDNDNDLLLAINHLKTLGGGYVLAAGGHIVAQLALPLGGLMSVEAWQKVQQNTAAILAKAHTMGIHADIDPFITLSFMALPVIPAIRLTDKGLFDVATFSFIND